MPKKSKPVIQVVPGEISNTITISPAVKWMFTLNNYTENDINYITETMDGIGEYVFETEVGAEGTPHLQGYIEFNEKSRPKTVFNATDRIRWKKPDPCRRSLEQIRIDNWIYCTKDYIKFKKGIITRDTKLFRSNWDNKFEPWLKKQFLIKRELFQITELKPFQQTIYDIIFKTEPDRRSIHWFWQGAYTKKGRIGKSVFVNYLYDNHPDEVLIFDKGKYEDLCYAITEADMDYVRAIVWDMPRECEGNVTIMAMESILNGRCRSTKYEGGFKRFAPVHIIVVGNFPPNCRIEDNVSDDRLKVTELSDDL